MKRHTVTLVILPLILVGVLLGGIGQTAWAGTPSPRMTSANYALDWTAAGEISGGQAASANYALRESTTGQKAAGSLSASANYKLCSGWECTISTSYLNLPFLSR